MTTIHELANELLLLVFEELTLQVLIASRGVNRKWRSLVLKAHIHPARRKLLDLYTKAIASPAFLATRTTIIHRISPFDRAAYIATVEDIIEHCSALPDEFRLWLLERPARAAISWFWPGLPTPYGRLVDRVIEPEYRCYQMTSTLPISFGFNKIMVRRCRDSEKLELKYYNEDVYEQQGWQGTVWFKDLYYESRAQMSYCKYAIAGEGLGKVLKGKAMWNPGFLKDMEGERDTGGSGWAELLSKELNYQDEMFASGIRGAPLRK